MVGLILLGIGGRSAGLQVSLKGGIETMYSVVFKLMRVVAVVALSSCAALATAISQPSSAAAQTGPPPAGWCLDCSGFCPHRGYGECDYTDSGIGSNECLDDPWDFGGKTYCGCFPSGGVCFTGASAGELRELESEALDMLASGDMLPANGPFYLASRGEELILRSKCDGRLAAYIAPPRRTLISAQAG